MSKVIDGREMKGYLERCWNEMPAAQKNAKACWSLYIQNDMVKRIESKAGSAIRVNRRKKLK